MINMAAHNMNRNMTVLGLKFDYRLLIILPVALLIFSSYVLLNSYLTTGEWFVRGIELKGGTMLSIKTGQPTHAADIEKALSTDFGKLIVRELRGFGEYGASIEMDSSVDYKKVMDRLTGSGIKITDFSVENTGPSLSTLFWSQAQMAIILAFVLIWIITFIVFRTVLTSFTTMLSAISDLLMTMAFMQIFGIEFSLASLGALLMMLGYSVDTDIMLNSRLRKDSGEDVNQKVGGAVKTGLTMTFTSIGAVGAILLTPVPDVLIQIASVLFIGLFADIVNTWFFNSPMLRWYFETRGARNA
jgi:preprotein translocase subunit SecF